MKPGSSVSWRVFLQENLNVLIGGTVKANQPHYRPGQGSRKLRLSDFVTTAQDGGKVVSFTHRLLFTPQEILLVLISVRG